MPNQNDSYKAFQELMKLQFGVTPVDADPVKQQKLYDAINNGRIDEVQSLLKNGAHPVAMAPNSFGNPLGNAISSRQPEIVRLLIEAGASPDDGFPHTPLSQAVQTGSIELVKTLISCGANLQHINRNPETPLLHACLQNQIEIARILLEAGADPNYVARKESWDTVSNYSPLEYASMAGKRELVKLLSQFAGKSEKETDPLMLFTAIVGGDLPSVKEYIGAKKIHPDSVKDASGMSPLVAAAMHGKAAIVKYLIQQGADVNRIAGRKHEKETPLIAAVCSGKLNIVRMIVEAGADLDATSPRGVNATPLAIAKEARLKKITEYLVEMLKKAGNSATIPPPVGMTTFDTNDAAVLVEAPVNDASRTFANQIKGAKIKSNVYGKSIALTDRSYGVFRIKNQPWTCIMRLICDQYQNWPNMSNAQSISESLHCRTLLVACSDTAGASQYVLFDDGKVVEYFEHADFPADSNSEFFIRRFRKIYNIDISHLPTIQTRGSAAFASSVRQTKLPPAQTDLQFIEEYIKSQNAFVPFGFTEWEAPGEKSEIILEGLGGDDVEQMDVILSQ